MGLALPKWIIEDKNNIWVLGLYGILFGGVLPYLVGSWWFGSRQKTKDGVNANTAAAFFKGLKEESGIDDIVGTLGKGYAWESKVGLKKSASNELHELESSVREQLGKEWDEILKLAGVGKDEGGEAYERRKRALVLLYSHFLRVQVSGTSLQKGELMVLSSLSNSPPEFHY